MFRRFFDEGLAQSSYLIACEHTRRAVVVDPRRDIDGYLRTAAEHALTLTHAIDTHIHADYLSGSRELAAHGVEILSGPGAGLAFPHREASDREIITMGTLELTCLHTPGHTPEHISIVSRQPGEPVRAFTGDTLFVGAVGRPDLLGESVSRQLAGQLHDSLFSTLMALPDDVEVWPGHGAGSLCGSSIGQAPSSTIGDERRTNQLLQHRNRETFVDVVLADLPEVPPYFPRVKRVNRDGAAVRDLGKGVDPPPALDAKVAASTLADGGWLIDLRSVLAHGAGHPARSLSIEFGPKTGFWAAWAIPDGAPIVLLDDGDGRLAADTRRLLLRVGLDNVAGWLEGGFGAWQTAGLPAWKIEPLPAADLCRQLSRPRALTVVDVRSRREWDAGHLAGALHIPLQQLPARLGEIPRDRPVATLCEGGARSSLAASLLERHGIGRVLNVTGGMAAWRALEGRTT